MQFFGKFKEVHELEYLVKSYIYIPQKDENGEDIKLSIEELNLLLKKKNKNVAGTVFLYNPFTAPIGYKVEEKLQNQDFRFKDQFCELQIDEETRNLGRALKHNYRGKLIEVKYLFTYNKYNIKPTSVLEVFDLDLEKIHTEQLTVFAKKDNYHDAKNISYNGKFIFFAWGHKFDRAAHPNIALYASNIAQWAIKLDKQVGFIHDNTMDQDDSFEYTRFFSPVGFGKLKTVLPVAFETVFKKDTIEPYKI